MASKSMIKKQYTIKSILASQGIIKFQEDNTAYQLADNVKQYIDNLKPNDVVDISIEKDSDKIIFIKVAKNIAKSESKSENNIQTWTVKAITLKKDVVKFEEGKVSWYLIPENVRPLFANIKAKDKITVEIGTIMEKGKNKPAVISVIMDNSSTNITDEVEISATTNFEVNKTLATNNSIERQVALKEAGAIVRTLIEQKSPLTKDLSNIQHTMNELFATFVRLF